MQVVRVGEIAILAVRAACGWWLRASHAPTVPWIRRAVILGSVAAALTFPVWVALGGAMAVAREDPPGHLRACASASS